MKKDLLILSSKKYPENKSLYDIEQLDTGIKMYYSSMDKEWCYPGKLGYSLIDTDNNLIFIDYHTKKKYTIDYCAAHVLRALLKIHDTDNSTFELLERK